MTPLPVLRYFSFGGSPVTLGVTTGPFPQQGLRLAVFSFSFSVPPAISRNSFGLSTWSFSHIYLSQQTAIPTTFCLFNPSLSRPPVPFRKISIRTKQPEYLQTITFSLLADLSPSCEHGLFLLALKIETTPCADRSGITDEFFPSIPTEIFFPWRTLVLKFFPSVCYLRFFPLENPQPVGTPEFNPFPPPTLGKPTLFAGDGSFFAKKKRYWRCLRPFTSIRRLSNTKSSSYIVDSFSEWLLFFRLGSKDWVGPVPSLLGSDRKFVVHRPPHVPLRWPVATFLTRILCQ